jgi:hypothetical protein
MFDTNLPQEDDIRPPCPATNDQADSVDLLMALAGDCPLSALNTRVT